MNLENIDGIEISENTDDVVGCVSGYITHLLLQRTSCHICIRLLLTDVATDNEWINALNRGGLKLPSKLLYEYVKTAFCVLELLEEIFLLLRSLSNHYLCISS